MERRVLLAPDVSASGVWDQALCSIRGLWLAEDGQMSYFGAVKKICTVVSSRILRARRAAWEQKPWKSDGRAEAIAFKSNSTWILCLEIV